MTERNGKRRTREQISRYRTPRLGYYFIVTDTKETERNYFTGLRDSLPKELQGKLVIKVQRTDTADLIATALNNASLHPQYCDIWIVFDKDQVKGFDEIITSAEKEGVNVGWSNPCIETWFSAYFGKMPTCHNSVLCCKVFAELYYKATGQRYEKSEKGIYTKLCKFGDEEKAFLIAREKLRDEINRNGMPSTMCPATNVFSLVEEIKKKIENVLDIP